MFSLASFEYQKQAFVLITLLMTLIWGPCPTWYHEEGGLHDMYYSQPPGDDWDVLASLTVTSHVVRLYRRSMINTNILRVFHSWLNKLLCVGSYG